MLRIIQTPARFSPAHGGVERYVLELSKQLVARGIDVTVVCADEPHAKSCAVEGVKAIRLPYMVKVANTNITHALFRTLMSQRFDIMHTHIPTPWSADISALVSLLKRKPLFVTYHNDLTGRGASGLIAHLYNFTFLHFVLWRAKGIIITQPQYVEYSRHLKLHKKKVVTIPPGVAVPLTTNEVERKKDQVSFMSVLDKHHEYKGLGILLDAMVQVRDKRPGAKLLVGGGGELIPKYERQAKALGISESVEFLGHLPDKTLAELYSSSSVFVLPSLNTLEGFGLVALEALSYATPVITTHLAGSSEFIARNRAGLIVPPGDADLLARAIVDLLEDHEEARSMGIRGAAGVNRDFSWDSIARKMTGIYRVSMKTSRIVQVSAYYPPHLGGQEIAVQDLAKQLALTGKQVEVVTSDRGARRGVNVENGVRVTRLKSGEFGHTAVIWGLLFWLLKHAKRDTIVHLHVGQFFTPEMVWLASKIRRFRYIIHMHCDLVQSGPMGKFLPVYKKLFLGREIRNAEVVVVLNNKLRQAVGRDYGYDGKLAVMSNGIDEAFFKVIRKPAKAETLKLLFVGRLSPHKNLAVLLEALSEIKQEVMIDIIGDGECRHELESKIKDRNLENVRLHGRLSRDEIMGFYSTCDALILPSIYEVQPIALLEAMASRIPIITTRGIGTGAEAGEAILIEPTTQGIVDGIAAFAAMSSEAEKRLVDAAFKKAEKLGWSTLITSYIRLYEEVI